MSRKSPKKIKVALFIEGSYLPAYDGYAMGMSNHVRLLHKSGQFQVTVVHCYRGWSDLRLLRQEGYDILLVSPKIYYHDPDGYLEAKLREIKPDFIQMQDPDLILTLGLRLKTALDCKIVCNAHFVAPQLTRTVATNESQAAIVRKTKLALRASDVVFCLTEEDKTRFVQLGIVPNRVRVIPVILDVTTLLNLKRAPRTARVVFLGNLFFEPNEQAVRIILDYIYPNLITTQPKLDLVIIGDCSEVLRKRYQHLKGVHFTGRVKSLSGYFKTASLALVPILESTGIRSKLLFFFAAGVPCLCTSEAIEGIPGSRRVVFSSSHNFKSWGKRAAGLLLDKQRLMTVSRNERDYMRMHYSNTKLQRELCGAYQWAYRLSSVSTKINTSGIQNFTPPWLHEFKVKGKFRGLRPKVRLPVSIINNRFVVS